MTNSPLCGYRRCFVGNRIRKKNAPARVMLGEHLLIFAGAVPGFGGCLWGSTLLPVMPQA